MESSVLKDLHFLFSNYGWFTLIAFLALVFLGRFVLSKINVWKTRHKDIQNESEQNVISSLKEHEFFSNATFKMNVEIPILQICADHPRRQQLFRDLLLFKIKNMHDCCVEIVNSDMLYYTGNQWASVINDKLEKMLMEFEENARSHKVPEIAIKKFSLWHHGTLSIIRNHVRSLASSEVYTNNASRTSTFLMLMNLLLTTTVADAETNLININGELSGLEYNGQILE